MTRNNCHPRRLDLHTIPKTRAHFHIHHRTDFHHIVAAGSPYTHRSYQKKPVDDTASRTDQPLWRFAAAVVAEIEVVCSQHT